MKTMTTTELNIERAAKTLGWEKRGMYGEYVYVDNCADSPTYVTHEGNLSAAGVCIVENVLLEQGWTLGRRAGHFIWRAHHELPDGSFRTYKDPDRAAAALATLVASFD